MITRYEAIIDMEDGTEVWGQVMYMIVWSGKSLSGHEVLVRGEDIKRIRVEPNQEGNDYYAYEEPPYE